jgi:hypothetical protein
MAIFPLTQVPLIVPGCVGWLDASDASTITSSGGAVSSVRNKANSQVPFTQAAGAKQPLTAVNTIAGKNVLTFDGVDDQLDVSTLFPSPQTTGFTVFIVAFPLTPVVGTIGIFNAGPQRIYFRAVSGQVQVFLGTAPTIFVKSYGTSSTLIMDTRFDVASGNGVLYVNNSGTTALSPTFSGSISGMSIGVQTGATNPYFPGYIAECVFYNTSLSDSAMLTVRRYLSNKWGVTLS